MRPLRIMRLLIYVVEPFSFTPARAKEFLNQVATFFFEHAGRNLNSVIQKICITNTEAGLDRSRFLISSTVNQPPHSCLDQSARAHRTRFDRRIDNRVSQPVVVNLLRSLAQRDDFCMGRWVSPGPRAVPSLGQQYVSLHNTSTNWYFIVSLGIYRRLERDAHPMRINVTLSGHRIHRRIHPSNNKGETIGMAQNSVKPAIFRRLARIMLAL